jgi:hypothetical protein
MTGYATGFRYSWDKNDNKIYRDEFFSKIIPYYGLGPLYESI